MSRIKFVAVALGLALVAAACGGDDAETVPPTAAPTTAAPTTTTTTTTTTIAIAPTTTTEAPLPNIVEMAVAAGQFNTLLELAQIAQLEALLTAPGIFTVFAPNDDAFAALPEGVLDGLKADPEAAAGLLTSHALLVQLDSEQVAGATSLTAASGAIITVEVDADGNTVLNGVANIIQADLVASNGVVHVIDAVLLPPDLLG